MNRTFYKIKEISHNTYQNISILGKVFLYLGITKFTQDKYNTMTKEGFILNKYNPLTYFIIPIEFVIMLLSNRLHDFRVQFVDYLVLSKQITGKTYVNCPNGDSPESEPLEYYYYYEYEE